MEIDFHFGATYVVARLAGFDHGRAEIIATCSQYVDDTVNSGALRFKTGESYYRISTAHELTDYHIALSVDERRTWVPFHFLPGNDASGDPSRAFYNRIICRPHSEVAKEMARACIAKQDTAHGLHRLGITAHVFIDTWAHQGFAGIHHRINMASDITLVHPHEQRLHWLHLFKHGGPRALWGHVTRPLMQLFTDHAFPMGHGAVLHYPDHPFRQWRYTNGDGQVIVRDNPTDFLTALDELCRVFRRYLAKDAAAQVEGLSEPDREKIRALISKLTNEDPKLRLNAWLKAVHDAEFSFGAAKASYAPHGPGSWKQQALGIDDARVGDGDEFDYTPAFDTSNWKLFHDAAQAHQHDVLREILPRFGICAV
ncbi:MAG: hypothetical protein JST54_12190 [Deltaproteobacteria bacterium]|nr:hypothetical protein [Deltaproteobacteria bacterium]